jgi:hypothetical protein
MAAAMAGMAVVMVVGTAAMGAAMAAGMVTTTKAG